MFVWFNRVTYSERMHLCHFFFTNAFLIIQLLPLQCQVTMRPLTNYFYTIVMTVQITLFSSITALAPIQAILAVLVTIITNAFALGIAQESVTTFEIFLVLNSLLIIFILVLNCVWSKFDETKE